jgi:hypothetical protein
LFQVQRDNSLLCSGANVLASRDTTRCLRSKMLQFSVKQCRSSNLLTPSSTSATTYQSTSNVSDIIGTLNDAFPDASSTPRVVEAAEEVARANGGELHNISALTGGMVAQEVIKIITKQYIPIDNTCIFDGITSRTQVLRI